MRDASEKRARIVRMLWEAVLGGRGVTAPPLRQAVAARAAAHAGWPGGGGGTELPAEVAGYADAVAVDAAGVGDADIERLRQQGYGDDAIFELTLSAALGAGLGRLERGLAAVRGSR